jgi:formamidopyrimidine-DNA glycosylase
MPELPEVETVARELHKKLKNRVIQSVWVMTPKMVSVGPATVPPKRISKGLNVKKFTQALQGKNILQVKRRAKVLIFKLSDGLFLLVHLKMTGQFIFEDQQLRARTEGQYRLLNKASAPLVSLPSKHTHVIFNFPDSSKLFFNDVRKFGYLKLVSESELDQVEELKAFGPEPLDPNFTVLQFISIIKRFPQRKIKEVLVDPTVVAGIGNIYSDEILFLAGIRPARQVFNIKSNELKKIYENIKLVLKKGIQAKGSSVGEYVRTDGSWGEMGKYHWVYGRKGQKCKKCGSIIVSAKFGGRTGSFCPQCQK